MSISSRNAGTASSTVALSGCGKMITSRSQITRLCRKNSVWRQSSRYTCRLIGAGRNRIRPSFAMKTSVPSRMQPLMKFQISSPVATYGRNVWTGSPNSAP